MKRTLTIVGLVIIVLIAGVMVFAASKPDTFTVQRSAAIKAPPEKIFPLIDDFMKWRTWSPWENKDPGMKRIFDGTTTSGKGATYLWEGNKDVGEGSMEIVESIAPSRLKLKLDFVKPFEA